VYCGHLMCMCGLLMCMRVLLMCMCGLLMCMRGFLIVFYVSVLAVLMFYFDVVPLDSSQYLESSKASQIVTGFCLFPCV
jgi:hypothetical protein